MTQPKRILFSLILASPVIAFLLHYYIAHSAYLQPTGFTLDENVLYMSYAHQYLDQESFSFFYSNPFDGDPSSPRIYIQPVNYLFAILMKWGLSPGWCLTLFGLLMAILCIYISIRIIELLIPNHKYLVLICTLFTWGGGLSAIAGLAGSTILSGHVYDNWLDGIYLADPANGWWGLNWGRNLFIPLEAYYHFLFLVNIYCILRKKWIAGIIMVFFLSVSHPFTGAEFIAIAGGWLALEKLLFRNKMIPWFYVTGVLSAGIFHGWYYLVYLQSFHEHRQLFSQYSAGWVYSLRIAVAAYALVAILFILSKLPRNPFRNILAPSDQRLFICWAIIAFLLSKHEWFIRPMQPIHFTRGYIWSGLFLAALPGLIFIIDYLKQKGKWLLAVFITIFLLDNTLWTLNLLKNKETAEWEGYTTQESREVFDYLSAHSSPNDLVIGNSHLINYMSNVYSSANAWVSHPYNTPEREKRVAQVNQYLKSGVLPAEWTNRRILIVLNKAIPYTINPALEKNKLFENSSYIIFTP